MMAEAVARELSPRRRRVESWPSFGGAGGEWVVTRRTAKRRERLLDFGTKTALNSDALSLMNPIRSLIVSILPMERNRK